MNTEDTNVARTRTTHKQSRERNARFAEMAQEPEIKKYLSTEIWFQCPTISSV